MNRERTDWGGVVFGFSLACLIAFQQFKLPPVMPAMLAAYGWDRTLAGAFMAVYALAGLLFSIPIGRFLQRGDVFRLLVAALSLMLLGDLLTLVRPQSGALVLVARGLEGAAFAVGAIAGPALATRSASRRHLGIVVGLTSAWIPVGQLLATGLALVLPGWQSLWLAAAVATGILLVWSFAIRRHGSLEAAPAAARREPLRPSIRQRWQLLFAAGIFLLWSTQYFAFMTWLPQYLVEVVGLGHRSAAAGYALPVVVLLGFNMLTGLALGAGLSLGPLLSIALLSQMAVWWLIPLAHDPATGIGLLIAYGIGAGITPTCLFALPTAILGQAGAPTGFGFVMTGRNIGVLSGPILLAEVTKPPAGWAAAWPLFGTLTAGAVLAAVALAVILRSTVAGESRLGATHSPTLPHKGGGE
jgi:MFS family permease